MININHINCIIEAHKKMFYQRINEQLEKNDITQFNYILEQFKNGLNDSINGYLKDYLNE